MCYSSPAAFAILCLSSVFKSLIIVCLGVDFSGFILFAFTQRLES